MPFSFAIVSGRFRISSGEQFSGVMPNAKEYSDIGSGLNEIFGETLTRNFLMLSITSSIRPAVSLMIEEAKRLQKSYSERQSYMSIITILISGLSISERTFFTSEVFPIRLGDMRITFIPFSKSFFSLFVSFSLSVKLLPSTDIPYINGLSMIKLYLLFLMQRYVKNTRFTTLWTTKL